LAYLALRAPRINQILHYNFLNSYKLPLQNTITKLKEPLRIEIFATKLRIYHNWQMLRESDKDLLKLRKSKKCESGDFYLTGRWLIWYKIGRVL